MAESIKVFENSLRDYLIDVQVDAYNSPTKLEQRYNNLKVYMEPKKDTVPHFWVSANLSSVCFKLEPIEKIRGSFGTDERSITMWAKRTNIYGELKKHWAYMTKSSEIFANRSYDKLVQEKINTMQSELQGAQDTITGTGERKYKFKAFEHKKQRNLRK